VNVIETLRTNAVFKTLPEEALTIAAGCIKPRELAAGEVLFDLGDDGEEVYLVHSGQIAIYIPAASQAQAGPALRYFTPGEMFGEMAILENQPRSTSARAERGSVVLGLGKECFERLMNEFPDFAENLSSALSSRLRYTTELIRELRKALEEIRWLSITDGLTGLYNRRYFFEQAEKEVERAQRYRRPVAAIMLDVDFFKRVNDTFGHAAGDEVLREVALCCRREVRELDILGRYGGEEFAILLTESDMDQAQQVAERLRTRIESMVIPIKGHDLSLTVSLGLAELKVSESVESLLDRADQALYSAKQTGRNRVVQNH